MSEEIAPILQLDQDVLDALKPSILKTWDQIGGDACDFCVDDDTGEPDNDLAIEFCIDADRLELNAEDKEANQLVRILCKMHGYHKVLDFLSANTPLV